MGDENMVDQRQFGERQIANAGASVNQDVLIEQERRCAVLRAANAAGTTQYT
jgi:hypothetical protein